MPWLTVAWNWVLRVVGGWLPLGNKPIGEWLGKILWAVGICLAVIFVWTKFSAPVSNIKTGSQKAEDINNIYHSEVLRPSFGCASLRVFEYYKEKKEAKQE